MLDRAGMHIGWWYFAIRHAVLITNLVLLEAVEEGRVKATGSTDTVWQAHFGVQPRLDQYLLGPFGCLAFLLLSEEQRKQRGLCGHFGSAHRSLQDIYLGCACDSTTGVFQHLFTDGKTIFATAQWCRMLSLWQ
jgi:hypothetical protein